MSYRSGDASDGRRDGAGARAIGGADHDPLGDRTARRDAILGDGALGAAAGAFLGAASMPLAEAWAFGPFLALATFTFIGLGAGCLWARRRMRSWAEG